MTYIRTDSVRVAEEAQKAARGYIADRFGKEFVPQKPNAYSSKKNARTRTRLYGPPTWSLRPKA